MSRQLAFDLPANVRLGPEDFFVSQANEQAYAMVSAPAAWPDGKLALVGPAGSGKTHLARLFVTANTARVLAAKTLVTNAPMPDTAIVIEDGEDMPVVAQEWLFHAHNHLRTNGLPLLLTGQTPPARWNITLPDLASRLAAATTVTIENPDDPLLMAVLLKHFADRQLAPTPDAITYLQRHLPRTFDAIRKAVETLDREALAQSKPLTRPFVRAVLDSLLDSAPPNG
ncbi:DnaA/Hda family protein [Octadecabacter sp. G9-8]|uniref:DnaA/Hda family protein n=1 Tax=Octadecabacter dasysiphoniae TaxID=2909341 RepID=A0ABS9D0P1_9RHOB|nr:DnaA/Hda family protein [Octadecabacter dasysiphoniae]MCF2871951.1 DnaA/Hda family protein [Octadecabacter dasysiphoniae]